MGLHVGEGVFLSPIELIWSIAKVEVPYEKVISKGTFLVLLEVCENQND